MIASRIVIADGFYGPPPTVSDHRALSARRAGGGAWSPSSWCREKYRIVRTADDAGGSKPARDAQLLVDDVGAPRRHNSAGCPARTLSAWTRVAPGHAVEERERGSEEDRAGEW